ncbi:MAG: hypothetical protein KGL12_15630 [Rhodospirillales bacterium]|nr:hypothetical protein [Rhodospirillales bacterium]
MPSSPRGQAGAVAVLLGIAVIAAVLLYVPFLRGFFSPELDYSEGWNVMRQHMAMTGQPLYGTPPGTAITNYLPLSFYLVGLLGKLTGSFNLAGRIVSFVSQLGICFLLARWTFRLTGLRIAGVYTVLCFLCWVALADPKHLVINAPDLMALFFEISGFLIFFDGRFVSRKNIMASAFLMTCAFFTKPYMISLAGAVVLCTLVKRRWGNAVFYIVSGLIFTALASAGFVLLDGVHILSHLLRPRPYSVLMMGILNVTFFVAAIPGLILAKLHTKFLEQDTRRILLITLLATHLMSAFLCGGDGVAGNIFIETLAIDAVVLGAAFGGAVRSAGPVRVMLFLAPVLWPLLVVQAGTVQLQHEFAAWNRLPAELAAYDQAAAILRATPGPIVCEDLLLCYRAGKSSAFDPYFVKDQIRVGRLSEAAIDAMLVRQAFGAIEIGAPDDRHSPFRTMPQRFCAGFMRTLFAYYRPVLQTPFLTIFTPAAKDRLPSSPPAMVACDPPPPGSPAAAGHGRAGE